ncbi:MAG: addiction module protein [Gammaproteobacteria bacterium]|nr:addiction module protein [Gammaproteobacteria bacterium]
MARPIEEIEKELFELPREDRARVARDLIVSLDQEEQHVSPEEWDRAWKAEIAQRLEDLETGKTRFIPGEEVMRRAREQLKQQ